MPDLFVYGPLQHAPLLSCVMDRKIAAQDLTPTQIADLAVMQISGTPNATLMARSGAVADGALINLTDAELSRVAFYLGAQGFAASQIDLATGQAIAFTANAASGDPFDPSAWLEKWAALESLAAQEAMEDFGLIDTDELAFRFTMIRVRAAAKITAQQHNPAHSPSGFRRADVVDYGADRKFTGFFSLAEQNIAFRQYDGSQSAPVKREVFLASDATIVLPYDPVRDRVLLIEQFRPGPYARNDETPWMLEPIAGRIDPGESPETTAYREAEEEAGLTLTSLHEVAKCYASPGCSNEYFNIYVGLADLPDDCVGTHGLDSEAEDIRSYLFSYDRLMEMVDGHQTANAPLVLAALWLARKRESLRKLS